MPVDPARLAACFDEAAPLDAAGRAALLAGLDDPALHDALARLLAHDRPPPPATSEPVPTDMSEGTRVGELVILGKIGAGATSTVHAARDLALDRTVAVKRLADAVPWDSAELREEARTLARLSHPNVVQLHELREHAGELLLVMEHVQGAPLGAWARQAPRSWRTLLGVLLQAGRGLAAAHAIGIVHGDFKPDNILVGDDGRVRVVDFGLARLVAGKAEPGERRGFAGTPAFMAPEQFTGQRGDARSDQFSFCVTLYTCLFGQPPFPASSIPELADRLTAPPEAPPANELPPALLAALLRGLARAPANRWPDMDALLAALEREHTRDPEDDLRVGRRQRRVVTVGLLVIALGVDTYVFLRPDAAPSQLTPRDLVVFMIAVLVLLSALVAGFWRSLKQNRANRQLIGAVLLALVAVLAHRLFGLAHATPPPHTLAVDLLIMATCSAVTALTFRRQFAAPALIFLLAAVTAALAPARAPAVFSACGLTTFALVLLWWPRDGEL
ncbi:MAG: serine/threonine protein kinase [Nannocystis sp.]|uniref:serine/threonine-protein kinase n=1 Tax=Nannocystis sp. TaxID=1962667 RepID=UPI0024224516|nr:serine/threonine-protein kinase [Nannocystis sp.]MBK9756041.1 serine/threonine protein kinase [Nannocystis sp.]